jgi:hypothetical protein
MKRTTKKKLVVEKQTLRALVQPLDTKALERVVGGSDDDTSGWGSIVGCATRRA